MKRTFAAAVASLLAVPAKAGAPPDTDAAPTEMPEGKELRCLDTSRITAYEILSDEQIRLRLKGRVDVILKLRSHCDQLHYHDYLILTPVNGELCAGHDDVVTRTGLPCKIESLTEYPRQAADQADEGDGS